ncbi:MAG: hypothetical protein KBD04_05880 [Proteobacteria bacterium]|nr:hypothetical protein [Pseudomonadota bacterium]
MISSLEELSTNTQKEFELLGSKSHFKDILLEKPGITESEYFSIQNKFLDIPISYISVLKQYNLNGVNVGGFNVSPFSYNPDGILANLKEANDDTFFPKEFMEKHKMYQVGSCNTDLICITAGTKQFSNGEVLLVEEGYDIYNPKDSQIHLLAKDFEQFLIIAGNFGQVRSELSKDESNYAEKKEEFLDRLKRLKVDKKYCSAWW